MSRGKVRLGVMISVVSERYGIHPQTLRLYEREGLLQPTRSEGNTRLYDARAIQRLENILTLTRDMGVNLAGVEVILNLQDQLEELRAERDRLRHTMERTVRDQRTGLRRQHALVRVSAAPLVPLANAPPPPPKKGAPERTDKTDKKR